MEYYNYNDYYPDYLMHYGVKGMKWGHRKSQAVIDAKAAYKSAKKEYSKAYDKAYGYSSRHMISQYVGKKQKAESDRRWDDAINKAEASRKARENYKQAKKAERAKAKADKILAKNEKVKYKETIKQYRKEINAGESAIGKLYNKLTDADKYQAEIMYDQRNRKKK